LILALGASVVLPGTSRANYISPAYQEQDAWNVFQDANGYNADRVLIEDITVEYNDGGDTYEITFTAANNYARWVFVYVDEANSTWPLFSGPDGELVDVVPPLDYEVNGLFDITLGLLDNFWNVLGWIIGGADLSDNDFWIDMVDGTIDALVTVTPGDAEINIDLTEYLFGTVSTYGLGWSAAYPPTADDYGYRMIAPCLLSFVTQFLLPAVDLYALVQTGQSIYSVISYQTINYAVENLLDAILGNPVGLLADMELFLDYLDMAKSAIEWNYDFVAAIGYLGAAVDVILTNQLFADALHATFGDIFQQGGVSVNGLDSTIVIDSLTSLISGWNLVGNMAESTMRIVLFLAAWIPYQYFGTDGVDFYEFDVRDLDGDGYDRDELSGTDCDDFDPLTYPGAPEACGDGEDNDCDGIPDNGCQGNPDNDGDGYPANVDCDDGNDQIYPGASDGCDNQDNDCDGQTDEDCLLAPGELGVSTTYLDLGNVSPGGVANGTLDLFNNGEDSFTWAATTIYPYLSLSPSTGVVSNQTATIGIALDASGYTVGDSITVYLTVDAGVAGATDIDVIAHVDGPAGPELRSGEVDPYSGDVFGTFEFYVGYKDANGDTPSQSDVVVRTETGWQYFAMSSLSQDYSFWSDFYVDVDGSDIGPGLWEYYFEYTTADGTARYPDSGTLVGPYVGDDPPTIGFVEPVSDYFINPGDVFSIQYTWGGSCSYLDLYYGPTRLEPATAILIQSSVPLSGYYDWDTASVADGAYYIYAVCSNDVGQSDWTWSPGRITVGDVITTSKTFGGPVEISPTGSHPDIEVDVDGRRHVVWDNGDIYYSQSDDGVSWTAPLNISSVPSGAAEWPRIAIGDDGRVHVVYWYYENSDHEYHYSRLSNGGALEVTDLTVYDHDGNTEPKPVIAVGGDDHVFIAFEVERIDNWPHLIYDVMFARSTNGGDSFESATTIAAGYNEAEDLFYHDPDIAADSGYVYVTMEVEASVDSTEEIHLLRSSDLGASFGSEIDLTPGCTSCNYPRVAVDEQFVYVLFRESAADSMTYLRSLDNGSSWATAGSVPIGDTSRADVVAGHGGEVFAVSPEDIHDDYQLYFSESLDNGESWSLGTLVGSCGVYPKVAGALDGSAHMVGQCSGVDYYQSEPPQYCPTVTLVLPGPGQVLFPSIVDVEWQGEDQNPNDVVEVAIFYDGDLDPTQKNTVATNLPESGTYTWDTASAPAGEYYVGVEISDGICNVVEYGAGTVVINRDPIAEVITPSVQATLADDFFTVEWTAFDMDAEDLTIDVFYDDDLDPGVMHEVASGLVNTGSYAWNTSAMPEGAEYFVAIRVSDGITEPVLEYSLGTVLIDHPNTSPAFSYIPDIEVLEDSLNHALVDLTTYAHDNEDSPTALTYGLATVSAQECGVSVDAVGLVSVMPDADWFGNCLAVVSAVDSESAVGTGELYIEVLAVNDAPEWTQLVPSGFIQGVVENSAIGFQAVASDPEGDSINYLWQLDHVDVGGGTSFVYQSTGQDIGVHTVTAWADDGSSQRSNSWIVQVMSDGDGDLIPDDWEVEHGLDTGVNDASDDSDGDGLSNGEEWMSATDPLIDNASMNDSDGDGMPDLWESDWGLDEEVDDACDDPDLDGLPNLVEYRNGLDPLSSYTSLADDDGDGLPDLWEVFNGMDPESVVDADSDIDGDWLDGWAEFAGGQSPLVDNALEPDDENDGLPDTWEEAYCTDLLSDDSMEDLDGDSLVNVTEYHLGLNPNVPDTPPYVIDIHPDTPELSVGDTVIFTAVGGEGSISWYVADENVGVVDPDGLFEALSPGLTSVQAMDVHYIDAEMNVTVVDEGDDDTGDDDTGDDDTGDDDTGDDDSGDDDDAADDDDGGDDDDEVTPPSCECRSSQVSGDGPRFMVLALVFAAFAAFRRRTPR